MKFVIALLLANTSAVRLSKKGADIEGYSDPNFAPHPILPNSLYNHAMNRIPSVHLDDHIGESVWRSSMKGGDPNPDLSRSIINKKPMFNYPTK
jgi:hypothetical protein